MLIYVNFLLNIYEHLLYIEFAVNKKISHIDAFYV